MAHDATLRAKIAAQLEALETTARTAKTREQQGQHAELKELRLLAFAVVSFGYRIESLVREIEEAET